MIDVRTVLILLAVADLILAAALWIGASRGLRDGLSHWAASLVVRALAVAVIVSGDAPTGALSLGMALVALSMTLQSGALAAFHQARLPAWIHTAAFAMVAIPFQFLAGEPATAILFAGLVLGAMLVVLAVQSWMLPAPLAPARALLAAGFAVGAAAFVVRGLAGVFFADPVAPFVAPAGFAAATFLATFAAAMVSTLAFLLLHKERADAEAEHLATMDPLTGAYNRSSFHAIAERELSRARRGSQPLSLIMIDIDNFRAVNEEHGHLVGDEALARVAAVIRSALRKEDMLVRFGGEEFLVVLPDVAGPGAVVVAGRVRRAVADQPVEAGGEQLSLTASLGVAARLDEGPESIDELLERAESALALAKRRGRDRVVALSLGRSIAA